MAFAGFAIPGLDDPMRTDESLSFLSYGTRPLPVAVGFYHSTNNHILHSILMRVSVWSVGDSPSAIRIPAFLFGIAAVPLIYKAGRIVCSRNGGLVAAALYAGAPYAHELAVNARGYTIVNCALLAAVVAVPGTLRDRAASMAVMAIAVGLGCWAVPTMLYPAAAVVLWAFTRIIRRRGRGFFSLLIAVVAAGIVIAVTYAAPMVVIGPEPESVVSTVTAGEKSSIASRLYVAWNNLVIAFMQFAAPWGVVGAISMAFAGTVGALLITTRPGPRFLPAAAVIACGGIFAATGFAPPPWWSLAFIFPATIICVAGTLVAAVRISGVGDTRFLSVAAAMTLCVSWGVSGSTRPPDVPFFATVGFEEARRTVERLTDGDLAGARLVKADLPVYTNPVAAPPLNYYALREGPEAPRFVAIRRSFPFDSIEPGTLVVWPRFGDVWRTRPTAPPFGPNVPTKRLSVIDRTAAATIYRVEDASADFPQRDEHE